MLRLKGKKCVETLQNQTMGVIFNTQISQFLTKSLPTEDIFQVHGQTRPVTNLSAIDFRSQPREMPLSQPLTA